MARVTPVYSFDTSALIHAWSRVYPINNFPGFWDNLDDLIVKGYACCAEEVFSELKKKDDGIYSWCKDRQSDLMIPLDDKQQILMASIMGEYPRLVDTKKNRSGCDPFVIALAEAYSPKLTVVTQEHFGKPDSPRIPDVCKAKTIRCIPLLDVITEQNWKFGR